MGLIVELPYYTLLSPKMYLVKVCNGGSDFSFNVSLIFLLNCIWHGNTKELRMLTFPQSGRQKKELISKRVKVILVTLTPLIQDFQKTNILLRNYGMILSGT